jgi:flagellar M-ring protein FliF
VALIALLVAGVGLISAFSLWASTPQYVVAFNGLSETDAGAIVEQLQSDGTPYQLAEGGQILVQAAQVYEVRLRMARAGLPQDGAPGYELFSGNTLGMTEFMQRVNYQRAIEGELERTIGSLDAIRAVRVHIVQPEQTLLASEQNPTTASITVDLRPGQSLNSSQVRAITHLVASSVEGLQPEHVVVVDVAGTLLTSGAGAGDPGDMTDASDARRYAESQYATQLTNRIKSLLDQTLGPNKSVVQASVQLDWTERAVTISQVDPDETTLRSSQVLTETYNGDGSPIGGIPGSLNNLPPAVVTSTITGTAEAQYQRYEVTNNFEMTTTETQSVIPAGQVARLSVSVLVDNIEDRQQLETLRTAIAAAAGIDEARGDALAVETLTFDRAAFEEQQAEIQAANAMDLYLQIGLIVAGALLLGLLIWYVYRLLANVRLASAEAWTVMQPAQTALAAAGAGAPALGGDKPASAPAAISAPTQRPQAQAFNRPEDEALQKTFQKMADENPATVAEIIHLWLSEDEKKNG